MRSSPSLISQRVRRIGPAVWWAVLFLYSLLIFYVSSRPVVDVGVEVNGFDKLVHFDVCAAWASLCLGALSCTVPAWSFPKRAIVAAIAATAYGATDEYHQSFVDGRTEDLYDLLADGAGAVAAVLFWGLVGRLKRPPGTE